MPSLRRLATPLLVLLAALFVGASPIQAAAPVLDSGQQVVLEQPYAEAQRIPNIFENKAVYGKLEGATPLDIYSFTADQDQEQTFSLLAWPQEVKGGQPLLILMDPTTETTDAQLGLPLPSGDSYHTAVIAQSSDPAATYNEPALLTQYSLVSQQRIKLHKGKTYYFVVIDPARHVVHYSIKMGEGKAWGFSDIFKHFGAWFRVKADTYAGTGPFVFTVTSFGLLLFLLGLAVLIGTWVVEETFALLANRSKPAGYLLVKMQPFARVLLWVSLWFTAIGAYIFFHKVGWFGLPFILFLVFIPIVASLLYMTFPLSKRLSALEVTKREATIPAELRAPLYVSFVISLLSILGFLIVLGVYFTR